MGEDNMTESIPLGYKKTEIGVIPEDWEVDEIGNHTKINTGKRNTEDKIDNGKYPFFVRSPKVERINTYSFDGEAVLTVGDGVGTGKVFHYINGKFDYHQRVYKISNFSEKLNGLYFYYYFKNKFYHRIMQFTAKTSVDSVRMDMISKMKIPLPPLHEQRAIARVLSDIDTLIEKLGKLIEKKKNIKEGAMQQLLTGKKRLPGFEKKKGYKKTEIGIIPEDWEVKSLGDICFDIVDGTHKTPRYVKFGVPFYSVENVTNNNFKHVKYISEEEHKELIKRCKPEKGDILLTRIGDIGSTKLIDWDINASIYVSLAVLKIKDEYCREYLYAYSKTKQWRKFLKDRSLIHATPKKINLREISGVKIPIPNTYEEQCVIAQILSDIDAEIEALERKKKKYEMLKNGAMELLLTGKVRVIEKMER